MLRLFDDFFTGFLVHFRRLLGAFSVPKAVQKLVSFSGRFFVIPERGVSATQGRRECLRARAPQGGAPFARGEIL